MERLLDEKGMRLRTDMRETKNDWDGKALRDFRCSWNVMLLCCALYRTFHCDSGISYMIVTLDTLFYPPQ